MNPKLRFIISMCPRQWRMRYYCFGLFNSERVNIFLLWTLLPISWVAYHLTYSTPNVDTQWYIYFVSQQFYIVLLSVIIFNIYRKTRHAGISTAILLKSLFALTGDLLEINNKFSWISIVWNFIICALLFVGVYDYYKKSSKTEKDHGYVYQGIEKIIELLIQLKDIITDICNAILLLVSKLIDLIRRVFKK
jgi:hypothetical protein